MVFLNLKHGRKREKLNNLEDLLMSLKEAIRIGEVEVGLGIVRQEHNEASGKTSKKQIGINLEAKASLEKLASVNADFQAQLSKVSSQNVDESIKVIYDGMTVLNLKKIGEYLDLIISELELQSVAIIFDEWSRILLDQQPFLADMIRTTLISGRRIFIKFACIPIHTKLSAYRQSGQPIGFVEAADIFVDLNLDRIYNTYVDLQNVSIFMMQVLHKHLGNTIGSIFETDFLEVVKYFNGTLFEDEAMLIYIQMYKLIHSYTSLFAYRIADGNSL